MTLAVVFNGCGRYRMTLEPIFLILAAFALVELYSMIKNYFGKEAKGILIQNTYSQK